MITLFELIDDIDGVSRHTDGVRVHVEILPLVPSSPGGGLPVTGAESPLLLVAAAVGLVLLGTVVALRRRRST
ncbi:LPXTG cell wall anchor domain-containing protein [Microbacterium gorillae]|uniref:LPXTG cell wall anchor domain-containing protein n=1 Tax=Microbacterium gorillae TaxID=1231063 RepID=UPI003D976B9F